MILTDEEIEALTVRNIDARAIEAAVLAKLTQGVSVEPVHHIMSDGVAIGYYSLDQLTTTITAARVKALEDAALVCENESCSCCWTEDATEMASHLQDEICKLKGATP